MTHLTLLFEGEAICWDEETVLLAGNEPDNLETLADQGLLRPAGGGMILTEEGLAERDKLASEMGIPLKPMADTDPATALWRNRLNLLLEKAFLGRWGLKEFTIAENFPVVPYLKGEELFTEENGRFRYLWPEHPSVKDLMDTFPFWGVSAREEPIPGERGLADWIERTGAPTGNLTVDLMLRSGYDFDHYRTTETTPEDRFRLQNTDRLFCLRVKDPDDLKAAVTGLGQIELFMLGQRRIYIPGWADIDTEDQENWTMVLLVTDDDEQLNRLESGLKPSAMDLIEPSRPIFLLGTSVEALRSIKTPKETIYDWFCDEVRHIARPDVHINSAT
ncbi:MAG: hypothetical protein U9Q00_06665 [Synergistota bacterium]|nr:hypothetical protein [Synergistota bacterium]